MAEIDDQVKETLADVRKVGADYEEHQQEIGLDIPVDLVHFKKFPVVDPPGKYKKVGHDTRSDISRRTASNCRTTAGRSTRTSGSRISRMMRSSTCWR